MLWMSLLAWAAAAPVADCGLIRGATVHTPDGPQPGWDLRWSEGQITGVGPQLSQPHGDCVEVAGQGLQLTAGLVAPGTALGLVEIEQEDRTRDENQGGDDRVRASFQPTLAYDPFSDVIGETRRGGVTLATVHPAGGLVGGQVGLVQLRGTTQAEAVLSTSTAVWVNTGEGASRAAALHDVLAWLELGTRRYPPQPGLVPPDVSFADHAVARRIFARQLPLVVEAHRAADIEAWLTALGPRGIRWVLWGGEGAWRHAEALADAGVGVVVDPMVRGPGGFDQRDGRWDNAALLHAAGVDVALFVPDLMNARTLRQSAGNAVRAGLPHRAALAAITEVPARLFGAPERGRLEVGAGADLALWSGDPLETTTVLRGLWIEGQPASLRSRQVQLLERWRNLEEAPAFFTPTAP